ncbi:MAG TPA: serine/threonine-protein kinase, partial [Gemmataceae bacterium]
MARPSYPVPDVDRFLRCVARSGLVDTRRLRHAWEQSPAGARSDPAALAEHFVRSDLLTHYQVRKLLQGIWQGLVLGPYQVLAPLGRGGMGTVYLARDTDRARLVALKVLPPKRAREEEHALARFRREMEMCLRVRHPHLTETFDAGILEGVSYIAMEYIRGVNLSRYVAESGPLPVPRAARLFAEVASGLAHAHGQGLIHRDLKPSNIMVTAAGRAKVLDLGLALSLGEAPPPDRTILGGIGYVVGTMDYIAPEQAEDPTRVDARADLYAAGCSLYFALTGQPPFPGGTSAQKIRRHREEAAAPVAELNPTVPHEFGFIVERLMAKRPDNRFASAEEVRQALLPWAGPDPDLAPDVGGDGSESQTIREVEAAHAPAAPVWDSIPAIAFAARSPVPTPDSE